MNAKYLAAIVSLLAMAPFVAKAQKTVNLNDAYRQALSSDPTFKKAYADWLTQKENLPLAMTGNGAPGTGLFPNIDLTAGLAKNYTAVGNSPMQHYNSMSYQVTLTQPIFNLATWRSISATRYSVKSATANYLSSVQDLMQRVTKDYFEVLRANAILQSTLTEEKQVRQQLDQARAKFKVGLLPITDVYDAQAQYDKILANEIKNRNAQQDSLEELSSVTGERYAQLADLSHRLPMTVIKPDNINLWVDLALKQNYAIQAALYTMLSNRENIKASEAAKVPTVNFVGTYQNGTNPVNAGTQIVGTQSNINTTVGVNLNFPVLRGGFDIVNIKQSRYKYLSASDQLNITHRAVINNTRQAYLAVDSGLNQIKADKQAIKSAQERLKAITSGYRAGVQTMSDVLSAMNNLADANLAYANDRYNYVESIVTLKQLAGTLAPQDINTINSWLK